MDARQSPYVVSIGRALEELMRQVESSFDAHAISAAAGFSRYHFDRIFRLYLGESPSEMFRRLRLERAAQVLRQTGDDLDSIAWGVGYASAEPFIRAFQAAYGLTPHRYRASNQGWRLPAPNSIHFEPVPLDPWSYVLPIKTMNIEVQTLPETPLLLIRHVGPYPTIGSSFERFWEICGPKGVPGLGDIAVYRDNPLQVEAHLLRSDAGTIVPSGYTFEGAVDGEPQVGEIHHDVIPAGRYAVARHVGSYSELPAAWDKAVGAIVEQGLKITDTMCLEWYRNDCRVVPEDELLTDIMISIE